MKRQNAVRVAELEERLHSLDVSLNVSWLPSLCFGIFWNAKIRLNLPFKVKISTMFCSISVSWMLGQLSNGKATLKPMFFSNNVKVEQKWVVSLYVCLLKSRIVFSSLRKGQLWTSWHFYRGIIINSDGSLGWFRYFKLRPTFRCLWANFSSHLSLKGDFCHLNYRSNNHASPYWTLEKANQIST